MEITRAYFKNFWKFAAAVFGVVATVTSTIIALQKAHAMIDYYCASGNPFLGVHLQGFAACPVYITLGWIILISLAFSLFGFGLALFSDAARWIGLRVRRQIVNYFKRVRDANVLVFTSPKPIKLAEKLEIFIFLHNEEFWLNAKEVYGHTSFIFRVPMEPIQVLINWYRPSSVNPERLLCRVNRVQHSTLPQ